MLWNLSAPDLVLGVLLVALEGGAYRVVVLGKPQTVGRGRWAPLRRDGAALPGADGRACRLDDGRLRVLPGRPAGDSCIAGPDRRRPRPASGVGARHGVRPLGYRALRASSPCTRAPSYERVLGQRVKCSGEPSKPMARQCPPTRDTSVWVRARRVVHGDAEAGCPRDGFSCSDGLAGPLRQPARLFCRPQRDCLSISLPLLHAGGVGLWGVTVEERRCQGGRHGLGPGRRLLTCGFEEISVQDAGPGRCY